MEQETETRQYVSYVRVSRDSFKDGKSTSYGLGMDAQRGIIKHFVGETKEFVETKSAKNIKDRPVLQEAIKYAVENKMWLCIAKLDRLSRDVDDVRFILKQMGGRIIFCDIPSKGKADIFTITIYAAFAERERMLIGLRTRQALEQRKIRNGGNKRICVTPKYVAYQEAFVKSGKMNELAVKANKEKAASNENSIRAGEVIKARRKEGLTYGAIAEILNTSKFVTPTGLQFHPAQVQRIWNRSVQSDPVQTLFS